MSRRASLLRSAICGAVIAALMLPGLAAAAPAFTTTRLSLRAGPSTDYPAVALIENGVQVEVLGCLEGYGWCDAVVGQDRGWLPGEYLQGVYYERREPLIGIAPSIGLPIVGFTVGTYWDRYYRGRPWYAERERWVRLAPPPPPPSWGHGGWRHDGPSPGWGGPSPGWGGPDRGWHRGWDRGWGGGPRPGWDHGGPGPGPRPDGPHWGGPPPGGGHGPGPGPRPDMPRPAGDRPGWGGPPGGEHRGPPPRPGGPPDRGGPGHGGPDRGPR
jgi:uncharacterized protein YraI